MTVYVKVSVSEGLPDVPGKYPVFTESTYAFGKLKSNNQFTAFFNGKSFEVNNQVVKYWLKEYKLSNINLVGDTIVLPL